MSENHCKNSFCVLPWIHSFVNKTGRYQVCCTSEEFLQGIPSTSGEFLKIQDNVSMNQVTNSETLKNLRLNMLQGEWNSICTRCHETEKMGGVSRRNIENKEYSNLISGLIEGTLDDGCIVPDFKSIDYRLGNLCNLKCRMCGPHSSSSWILDWNSVKPQDEQMTEEQRNEFQNYDWIRKDFLLTEFKNKVMNIDRLHFAGGEPLIAPQMKEMLKICIDLGISRNITLSYNSNITHLPIEVLDLWKRFKSVQLLCSVDGVGDVNDYIRHPSKWEIVDKNLSFLDEHADKYNISEIIISCTVQIYNALDLGNLFNYLKKFKKIIHAPNLINLYEPNYMQTTVLPKEAKEIASKRLYEIAKELEHQLPAGYEYLRENIFQAVNFMNNSDHSDKLFKFRKINTKMDNAKGLGLYKSIPELNSYVYSYVLDRL